MWRRGGTGAGRPSPVSKMFVLEHVLERQLERDCIDDPQRFLQAAACLRSHLMRRCAACQERPLAPTLLQMAACERQIPLTLLRLYP